MLLKNLIPDKPNGLIEHKLEWRSDSKFCLCIQCCRKKKVEMCTRS